MSSRIKKIVLCLLRLVIIMLLAYIIYRLYLYHVSGYEVVVLDGASGYRLLISSTPALYQTSEVTFFRSISVLILAVPALFVYIFLSMLISDCIKKINVNSVSDKKVFRTMRNTTLTDIIPDCAQESGNFSFGGNKKNYMSTGIVGRRELEAKHSAAPDIYEGENSEKTVEESDS